MDSDVEMSLKGKETERNTTSIEIPTYETHS
jgi:hypothetical protein